LTNGFSKCKLHFHKDKGVLKQSFKAPFLFFLHIMDPYDIKRQIRTPRLKVFDKKQNSWLLVERCKGASWKNDHPLHRSFLRRRKYE